MTATENDLFRPEALEFRDRGGREHHGVVRLHATWLRWLSLALVLLIAAGLTLALTVRIDQTATGEARINRRDGTFVALVPLAAAADLDGANRIELEAGGGSRHQTMAVAITSVVAGDQVAVDEAGLRPSRQPSVLVRGSVALAPDAAGGPEVAQLRIVVRRSSVLGVIRDRVLAMFHGGEGR
jgi:hypothetical protein